MDGSIRLTAAQALVRYVQSQDVERDGVTRQFIPALAAIFGHGNVSGLGQALLEPWNELRFIQGHNEQSMVHMATAFARERRRMGTFAVTSSIGPGATNMITGASLATINRLPVLLLPSDAYATRRQGTVLQQLEAPTAGDTSVNDCFRAVSRYFDRIQRPEQLVVALPEAMRVLTDPIETGAVTISLPQDLQTEAHEYPVSLFERRTWTIDRAEPDQRRLTDLVGLIRRARRPLIIAGGGIWYSEAENELDQFSDLIGAPVAETFAGKGSMQTPGWRTLGGIGVEGTVPANKVAANADLVIAVGTRMGDFITGSQSLFKNPAVRFAGLNVDSRDAHKQGALPVRGDARSTLRRLSKMVSEAGFRPDPNYSNEIRMMQSEWTSTLHTDIPSGVPMSSGAVIRGINEGAREGDVIITAAGAPPGELLKLWDATGGRRCHIEFGFSCMGYELPAGLGARLARTNGDVVVLVGDGSFLINPGELVTLAQERARVTIVILENHGYQVIRRLQMKKSGVSFGNEFRVRSSGLHVESPHDATEEGDYVELDLVGAARGLGVSARAAVSPAELTEALRESSATDGPTVIVVPIEKQVWLPYSGAWWDVAPAQVSSDADTLTKRAEYDAQRAREQRHYAATTLGADELAPRP
jgi:3D-(3,5/4)-trihydroxycyclohexane-1,2-dione acylhydrolase (decyclizing)